MTTLDLDDIQSGVLRPRPAPYAAVYYVLRVDDRRAGREVVRRLSSVVVPVSRADTPAKDTWVSVAISYRGLEALGVPERSLVSFAPEFRAGMAARAKVLGDEGESSPQNWESPLGSSDVHLVLTALSADDERLEAAVARARETFRGVLGVAPIWRQDCHSLPCEREAFGFRDGISHPAIEGSGISGSNPHEPPLQPGEFVLGYPDEMQASPPIPEPETLGKNGSYVAFRKLHQRVAEFRRYLTSNTKSAEEAEWLAGKLMGRWRSGAPLALCPIEDDPVLGADRSRHNAFQFQEDPIGYDTPRGCHVRRMNPRDSDVAGVVRIHRMIRRGTSYGPPLPEGVLDDDGVERGLMFAFIGAHLGRQFEFVQSEWLGEGRFFGGGPERDPIAGARGPGTFDIPRRPLRRRLEGLPRFVITRGGEYCFLPGLRALQWLANLRT